MAITLVVTLGGHSSRSTPTAASAPSTPRVVAQQFVQLETRRYNAPDQAPDQAPNPTRVDYNSVSCRADLSQMDPGSAPLPPAPAHPRYTLVIDSIAATGDGRQLLKITLTDHQAADGNNQASGLYYLQREAGRWVVCGLYDVNKPPAPAGPGAGAPTGPVSAPSGPPLGGSSSAGDPQGFLTGFAQAVGGGLVGTAASAICTDAPQLDQPVLAWTNAHAVVTVQSLDTSGLPAAASARVQVSSPGQAPSTWGLVLAHHNGGWCLEDAGQE